MTKWGDGIDVNAFNGGGAGREKLRARIAAQERINARRIKCDLCDLTILPENMQRHLTIVHGDEND